MWVGARKCMLKELQNSCPPHWLQELLVICDLWFVSYFVQIQDHHNPPQIALKLVIDSPVQFASEIGHNHLPTMRSVLCEIHKWKEDKEKRRMFSLRLSGPSLSEVTTYVWPLDSSHSRMPNSFSAHARKRGLLAYSPPLKNTPNTFLPPPCCNAQNKPHRWYLTLQTCRRSSRRRRRRS